VFSSTPRSHIPSLFSKEAKDLFLYVYVYIFHLMLFIMASSPPPLYSKNLSLFFSRDFAVFYVLIQHKIFSFLDRHITAGLWAAVLNGFFLGCPPTNDRSF